MKKQVLVGIIVCGVLAVAMTVVYVKKKRTPPPPPPAEAHYVQAIVDIEPRTEVTDAMLMEVTEKGVQDGAYCASKGEIIGRAASEKILRGQRIPRRAFEPSPRVFPVPRDKRCIALFFDPHQTAAGLLNVGDHVDVHVVYIEGGDAVARTVMQDCVVTSIDTPQPYAPSPAPSEPATGKAPPPPPPPPGQQQGPAQQVRVVLATTPDGVVKIAAAAKKGEIDLALRHPDNYQLAQVEEEWEHPRRQHKHYPFPAMACPENIPTRPTGPGGIVIPKTERPARAGQRVPPAPRGPGIPPWAGPPPTARTVEVIRGISRETVTVQK